jgi:hypothetical protein
MADVPESKSERESQEKLIQWLTIPSPKDWGPTVATGNCVVYLNCSWNIDIVRYRTVFAKFAQDRRGDKSYKVAVVMMDENEQDKVSLLAQRLVDAHKIGYGTKNWLGAGLILWMKNGVLIDYCWCQEVRDETALRERTIRSFGESPG